MFLELQENRKGQTCFYRSQEDQINIKRFRATMGLLQTSGSGRSFLLTSADLGSLRKLIAGFKREDLLDFGNGKIIKKMKIGRWEVSKDRPDLSSFLPKI